MEIATFERSVCPIGDGDSLIVKQSFRKNQGNFAEAVAILYDYILLNEWESELKTWWDGALIVWKCTKCGALTSQLFRFGNIDHIARYNEIVRSEITQE